MDGRDYPRFMKIGLIGRPKSGKTTIFNALTRSNAEVASYSSGRIEPNIAVVDVEDPRVTTLGQMYNPKRTIFATIEVIDFVGVARDKSGGDLFSGEAMGLVKSADALAVVVRNFSDEVQDATVGTADPVAEAEQISAELILSDLILTETRRERIAADHARGKKNARSQAEEAVLAKVHDALSQEKPVRDLDLGDDERKIISGFQFLSAKPILIVLNSDEDRYGADTSLLERLKRYAGTIEFAGNFEMELAQLDDEEEAKVFMEDLGIDESARSRLTTRAYEYLGLISFFTVGSDEVRAWTIHRGDTALAAAGAIHSDLARGFIRAECFHYDDLVAAGDEKGVRSSGGFRLEGKDYTVTDGDILNIRFSV